jgi:hypothetical protein
MSQPTKTLFATLAVCTLLATGCSQTGAPESIPGPDPLPVEPLPPGSPENPGAPDDEPPMHPLIAERAERAERADHAEPFDDDAPSATPLEEIDQVDDTRALADRGARDAEPANKEPLPSGAIDDTIIIRRGGNESSRRSLVEASRAAREKKMARPPARIRVDDDNLHTFSDGQVTFAEPVQASSPAERARLEEAKEVAADEAYWRQRVLELRLEWRAAVEESRELELEVASLRRSFYAAEDPYVRDGRIKPAWDRALDRLDVLRRSAERYQEELAQALDEGRQAGAQPGWLREGIELEPEDAERDDLETHDPQEPRILEIGDDGRGRGRGRS